MKRALGILLLPAAVVLGAAATAGSFLLLARLTASVALLETLALVAFLLVTGGVAWAAAGLVTARRAWLTAGTVAAGLALVVSAARSTVLRSMDFPYTPARKTADVRYWDLPTGSRLAFVHAPAARPASPTPVVFVHGGPGQPEMVPEKVAATLSEAGFEVYAYHQHGAGLSSRAVAERRADEYTVARHVADLEAIRVAVDAERLILVAQSWGGTLAASYAAAHPRHVAKLVLTAPGPAWLPAFDREQIRVLNRLSADDQAELARLITPLIPRLALRQLLARINLRTAERFVNERQFDGFLEAQLRITVRAYACDGAAARGLSFPGTGYWVNRHVFADLGEVADPRPSFREVEAPVLILRPQCDYVAWPVTRDFRDRFPNATLLVVMGAGHEIKLERPEHYLQAIRAFLLGEELPLEPYLANGPP